MTFKFVRCHVLGMMWVFAAMMVASCGPERNLVSAWNYMSEFRDGPDHALKVTADNQDVVAVHLRVASPIMSYAEQDGMDFMKLDLEGYGSFNPAGAPDLPSTTFMVHVPQGQSIRFDIQKQVYSPSRYLSHDLAFKRPNPSHCGSVLPGSRDEEAYQLVYGEAPVLVEDVSFAGPDKVATIRIEPVYYDAKSRELKVLQELAVAFTFETDIDHQFEQAPVNAQPGSYARYLTINTGVANEAIRQRPPLDLIISHASHQEPLARYLDFKEEIGRETRIHYVQDLSASQIKSIIADEYRSEEPPTSTLLVGHIGQIPAWRGTGDNAWTDYPYQTLDSGSVPDIVLGRVPAHNASELNVFIDKAIAREREPRDIDEILLTAGRDVRMGCPTNANRVGDQIARAGSNIALTKRYRASGASTGDVIAAYNANPNIIVYDGHGNRSGMTEIPLVMNNLRQLSNTSYPLIMDIACLNSNWGRGPMVRNFAESILLMPEHGAAGILASGGSGFGHTFFQTIGRLMAEGRATSETGEDVFLNEVGYVVMFAKARHGQQDRSYWNYYGDPAASVWNAVWQ